VKWVEITVTTAPQAVEAVANILLECRTGGVEEAYPSPGLVRLRGYLPVGPAAEVILAAIEQRIRALPGFGPRLEEPLQAVCRGSPALGHADLA